jgi:UDP-GlcNAc:undecaprenyl-phosphate GlcNAc-1-phosphate transferase
MQEIDFFYLKFLSASFVAFLISYYLSPIIRDIALRWFAYDYAVVKGQKKPVPPFGGIALFIGFFISFVMMFPFDCREIVLLVPLAFLVALGFCDDIFSISRGIIFAGITLISIIFIFLGFHIMNSAVPWLIQYSASFVWFSLVITTFKMVDVMDGLAISLGIASIFSYMTFAFLFHQNALALCLALLLGSCFAVFYYNLEPAQISLGSSGSFFIGGCVASLPFLIDWSGSNIFSEYIVPLLLIAIPIIEITQLIVRQKGKTLPFCYANQDCFQHYLQKKGWTSTGIVIYIFILSLFLLFLSLRYIFSAISISQLTALFMFFLVVWFFLKTKKAK